MRSLIYFLEATKKTPVLILVSANNAVLTVPCGDAIGGEVGSLSEKANLISGCFLLVFVNPDT